METRDRQVVGDALDGRDSTALVLVAERPTGERLGFIHLCEEEDYYIGRCGHIGDVVVAESARGLGVGTELLAAAETWARSEGYAMLTLNVFVANERAARVYRSFGFAAETTRYVKILDE